MKSKLALMLLALCALVLVACGSSRHKSIRLAKVAVSATTSPQSNPTTARAPERKSTLHNPHAHPAASHATNSARTSPVAAQAAANSAPTTGPNAGIPKAARVSGPTPIICLHDGGLMNAHAVEPSMWEGYDQTNRKAVFIDGPYANHTAAQASAQGLNGVEVVLPAGLYVVSTALTSHLTFQVNAVGKCLSQAGGHGTLNS